jgi:hypothetical protein
MSRNWLLASLAALWLAASGQSIRGQEALAEPPKPDEPAQEALKAAQKAGQKADSRFIRIRRDDAKKPLAMETAIVRYVPADESQPQVEVDLIGAIHIGDKSYYEELNKRFESYDVLLYELVAPEGTRIPKGGRKEGGGHPVGALQNGMSSMLALTHQLDEIDYTKENFVHADMTPEEFSKSMQDRGESFMQMFLRMMGQGMAQQAAQGKGGGPSDLEVLAALFSKDRASKLKLIIADQFENLEGQMLMFDGPQGSTIITERNKKAFEVLKKQLAAGKKKIGVFYGAGHLPDMDERLKADFGLKPAGEEWVTAWSLERK